MGQQRMDKPPAKAKGSAEGNDAPDELRARGLQLAADYLSAFYRERTEENLEAWHLLSAIFGSPELRRALAQQERRLAGQTARTNPPHPRKFWRKAWVRLIPDLVAAEENDSEVVRLLIRVLPAELQAKCPNYPKNETEFEAAVAKVVAQKDFGEELRIGRKCGDLNVLKVTKFVLVGLAMKPDAVKSLMRSDPWASEKPPE